MRWRCSSYNNQQAECDFNSASSLKQRSTCSSTCTLYSDFEPPGLCWYSFNSTCLAEKYLFIVLWGHHGCDHNFLCCMVVGSTTTFAVTIIMITKVVSSNPTHDELYSIQYYVIKFSVTCDRSVVFSTNKTEILLKVALNTIC